MSALTIGEMIEQVREGDAHVFEPPVLDSAKEQFFNIRQNWYYHQDRFQWHNHPPGEIAPWLGSRMKPRIAVTTLPPPDVSFDGPLQDVVDFYNSGSDVFFISDALFKLIDGCDPNSLEQLECEFQANNGTLPFHAVMPVRALEAVDTRRRTVVVTDKDLAGWHYRQVTFPKGLVFNNEALHGVSSFSDIDATGWYWSRDLLEQAKAHNVRGLSAQSVASYPAREVASL